jgi:hypothetical protein
MLEYIHLDRLGGVVLAHKSGVMTCNGKIAVNRAWGFWIIFRKVKIRRRIINRWDGRDVIGVACAYFHAINSGLLRTEPTAPNLPTSQQVPAITFYTAP